MNCPYTHSKPICGMSRLTIKRIRGSVLVGSYLETKSRRLGRQRLSFSFVPSGRLQLDRATMGRGGRFRSEQKIGFHACDRTANHGSCYGLNLQRSLLADRVRFPDPLFDLVVQLFY